MNKDMGPGSVVTVTRSSGETQAVRGATPSMSFLS